ncbi:hypothetical protein V1289_005710 [Bradyrhizobium sp. AZCC 2289]
MDRFTEVAALVGTINLPIAPAGTKIFQNAQMAN